MARKAPKIITSKLIKQKDTTTQAYSDYVNFKYHKSIEANPEKESMNIFSKF